MNPITVTKPFFPPLNEFIPLLKNIWKKKWLTNNGFYHQELEKSLCEYLKVPYISLYTNGTITLLAAIKALNITGEVITTPYSFAATSNILLWSGVKPVFVDVEEKTGNIDPNKIEKAVTEKTTAILPVHVYGNPCDTDAIKKIADKYKLKIIYDAAHAFGVEKDGISILTFGDISSLSFHATKTFNTAEGGALIVKDENIKKQLDYLKNFGFINDTEIENTGINAKLDEMRCALGLLNLKYIDKAISARKKIASFYRDKLKNIQGISMFEESPDVKYNYSYFPVFINKDEYGINRDELFEKLNNNNIFARRYFYPLISSFAQFKNLKSANPENLLTAAKLADNVLCLPIYADLKLKEAEKITSVLINK